MSVGDEYGEAYTLDSLAGEFCTLKRRVAGLSFAMHFDDADERVRAAFWGREYAAKRVFRLGASKQREQVRAMLKQVSLKDRKRISPFIAFQIHAFREQMSPDDAATLAAEARLYDYEGWDDYK